MGRGSYHGRSWVARIVVSGTIGFLIWIALGAILGQAAPPRQPFDHDRTLFPLTGQHKRLECEACHTGGKYESLPTQCGSCHTSPAKHVVDNRTAASAGGCAACHDTTDWTRATFIHTPAMTAGLCSTCHNGQRAAGKSAGHVATTAECGACHTTTSFAGAGFQHDATAAGRCDTCHNGRTAPGKPSGHVVTTAQCDQCHNTRSFAGAGFQHDATAAGRCDTCHNGRTAMGKPSGHLATTAQCDQCHNTRSFAGATFRHDAATTTGRCDTCHDGQTAMGKPSGHLATTAQCDQCHRTTGWTPATYTNHENPRLIGGHSGLECKVCHPQSFTSAFYRDGVQFGFCSNCHRRDYKYPGPGEHRNAGTDFASSLQTNANCANCHEHAGYRW